MKKTVLSYLRRQVEMLIWKGVRESLAFWDVGGPTLGVRSHTTISGMDFEMWTGYVPSTKQSLVHLAWPVGLSVWRSFEYAYASSHRSPSITATLNRYISYFLPRRTFSTLLAVVTTRIFSFARAEA